ncbi:MAG: hypothetical protein V4687_03020 [Bacteroidota bacterium]
MKKFSLILICFLFTAWVVSAQDLKNVLEVRLTVLEESKTLNAYPNRTIGISFINNSNEDIFVPYYLNLLRNSEGYLTAYQKDSTGSTNLVGAPNHIVPKKTSDGYFLNISSIFDADEMTRSYNLKNKLIQDSIRRLIEKEIAEKRLDPSFRELFEELSSRPLLLRKHERQTYALNIPLYLLNNRPGEYVFSFEPLLLKVKNDQYPNIFLGHKKLYPTSIKSNKVYLVLSPMLRDPNEEK